MNIEIVCITACIIVILVFNLLKSCDCIKLLHKFAIFLVLIHQHHHKKRELKPHAFLCRPGPGPGFLRERTSQTVANPLVVGGSKPSLSLSRDSLF